MNDFPWNLLSDLRCPCCASRLKVALELSASKDGIRDGTLLCDCYEYPVVHGIPVLRQIGPVASTENVAVQRLRENDSNGALAWLLEAGGAPGASTAAGSRASTERARLLVRKMLGIVSRGTTPPSPKPGERIESFEGALATTRPRGYADYLFHRFANPSFLGALPPLIVLSDSCQRGPRRRLMDLLCGVGHSSAVVSALCPEVEVVMADSDFVNLYIARRHVAPGRAALCLDAELPLPFCDDSIDSLYCLDGLHYVRSKAALLEEVDRVLSPAGAWLFAHMHNARCHNINAGAPLDAQGYAARFAFGGRRMLPESEVIRQFQQRGSLDLTHETPAAVLDSSSALTLLGDRTEKLWQLHADVDAAFSRRPDLLEFNPLYRLEKSGEGLLASAEWPSQALRKECEGAVALLPESVRVSTNVLDEIDAARAGQGFSEQVKVFLRSFVLVCLPECYPRMTVKPC